MKTIIKVAGRSLAFISALFVSNAHAADEAANQTAPVFGAEIDNAKKIIDMIMEFCVKYSFQVLGGILVFVAGIIAAKIVAKFMAGFLEKHKVDVTVSKFIISIVKVLIMGFAALMALGNFGITIAPFIAGLSVIGFGTSFALQGPLSNYAAGITLIFTKPFKVGEIIEVTGVMGEVQDMTLARTLLKTVDGTLIVIPNKQIIGEIIHNYSEYKKLDITVGVSYGTDLDKAINIVKDIVKNNDKISSNPEPKIGVSEFADSSINIYSRLWCKQIDYYEVMFDVNRSIDKAFAANNVTIPFPQRNVHMIEKPKA